VSLGTRRWACGTLPDRDIHDKIGAQKEAMFVGWLGEVAD
jgi:hypothetical protein